MKNSRNTCCVMDFSGIYEEMSFWKEQKTTWISCRDLSGVNCYCDEEACEVIRERIHDVPFEGIHFIDSGNYHYMSRIWLERAQEPFRLLVFDNHTDMQPPAFGGLLSCGGWIADSLENLEFLQEVVLAGPDEEAFSQVERKLARRVRFLSRENLKTWEKPAILSFFREIPRDLPLCISIDKDILCPEDAKTSWSQGDVRLPEFLECLAAAAEGRRILCVDICGESEPGEAGSEKNNRANEALLDFVHRNLHFL